MSNVTPTGVPTKPYKAIIGFVLTFLGLVVQAMQGFGNSPITTREWIIAIVGALVTAGGVYQITNPPTR